MQLKDKTAVVTGAASGIGRATAETLAAAGAFVLLGDIDEQRGGEAAQALRERGLGAEFIRLDVTDLDSIAAFKQRAYELRGHVDVVANVAVLVAAMLVFVTGSRYPDLVVGFGIGLYVTREALEILKDAAQERAASR